MPIGSCPSWTNGPPVPDEVLERMKKLCKTHLKPTAWDSDLRLSLQLLKDIVLNLSSLALTRKACALKFTLKRFHNEVIQTYACRPNRR